MLNLIKSLGLVCTLLFVFSCGDDCETCTAETVIILDGVETSSGTTAEQEYCDDDLETFKSTAMSNLDAEGDGTEIRVNCK